MTHKILITLVNKSPLQRRGDLGVRSEDLGGALFTLFSSISLKNKPQFNINSLDLTPP
jgi:hypothetical protein